ncbi:MAG TPA: AAA family ATPase, partial [Streptosporangiaceae bacterium]
MPADMLVGRRLVIGALCSAVDAAAGGAGGVVLLAGEAGMGKTALASEAVAYAKAQGAAAVWGTCWEGDGAPGFWPWIQVVRGLARVGGDAGQAVLAELTGATGARSGVLGDESAVRFRTYDAAATYLRERAAQRPLVVVVDDLHWADVSSLRLLVFLARQLHDAAVLVIGTYRDVEVAAGDHPARPLLAELAGQAELLQLTGLTADEVGQLVEKVCGERPPAALARAVHDRTAGNPFFAQQIARLLASQGAPLDRAPVTGVPPAVGDVLARRLARLSGEVVDLLAAAAVAGQRFPIATAAAIAGTATETAVRLADSAVRAAVLEPDEPGCARFSHDLFREVLYDGLPAARRSELHLALAGLLEQGAAAAATAAEIAHHRSMAWPLGDRDRAIAALAEAGREATARTAFDEAAAHLRRAVEVAGGATSADLVTLCEYGDALRRAGHGGDAQAAFFAAAARARATGDSALFARAAFGAHRVATLTESSRSGVIALLEEALAALDGDAGAGAGATRWLLPASLARELADGPDRDLSRAVRLAHTAVDGARAAGDAGPLAYALFALGDVRWAPGTAAERLGIAGELAAAAAAADETELVLEAHLSRLAALLELGDPSFAVQLATFSRLAERAAIPRYLYLARSRQATSASLTGPLEAADELIESAAAYGERIGEPDAWGVQASQLVGLAFIRHDWTRLSHLATARGLALTPPEFAGHERAWLLIEAGDRDAAAVLVASMPERPAAYRWRHTALLTGDAELAAAVADRRRCEVLYEQLLPMAGEFAVVAAAVFTTGPVTLQLGLLAAALERWDDAVAHLDDAARRCDRLGARLLADRARAELARVVAARDRPPPGNADRGGGNVLHRDGDVWTVAFNGRTVPLRDAKGLRDLAVLLAAPGREVAVTELAAGVPGGEAPAAAALGADPILDDRARAAYRARLAELDDGLAEADARHDVERSARLAGERDALIGELARATGLGGRRRRLGDATERARTTVTARIRDAIGRIERAHPELGQHLRASIVTGARCAYRPAETVRW